MDEISHSVRPALSARETTYRLGHHGLVWGSGPGAEQSLAYADVESVRLISYATTMATAWQCTLRGRSGRALKVRSHHFAGIGRIENRAATYAPLVRGLVARVAKANPQARFVAGNSALWITWVVIGAGALVVLVLAGIATLGGSSIGTTAIPAIVILLAAAPLILREVRKGRARTFDPAAPPAALLGEG